MWKIKCASSDADNEKYFKQFNAGVPVFGTVEEAMVISDGGGSIQENLGKLNGEFNLGGSKSYYLVKA